MISPTIEFIREREFEHTSIDLGYADLSTIEIDGKRRYVIPTNTLKLITYPSITTVLSHGKNYALENWKRRVGEEESNRISRIACDRGSALHSLMERYINNENIVFDASIMPDAVAMFRGIVPEINMHIGKVFLQEKPLYSNHLKVAGRTDLIAEFDGRLSVIDFKTSKRIKTRSEIDNYFIQTCAYCIMFEERTGIPVDKLVIIMAVDGQRKPIVFKDNRDNWIDSLHKAITKYEKDHGSN